MLYANATFVSNAHQSLASLYLVVKLLARCACGISAHFATVYLLSGIAAVANLATGCICLSILAFVSITVEIVEVTGNVLIAEVEEQGWVQGYAAETSLEVEVRTSTSTCITTQADYFPGSYLLVL